MNRHYLQITVVLLTALGIIATTGPLLAWTPPCPDDPEPTVYDEGEFTCLNTQLRAWWVPTEQTEYWYAIGTTQEGTELVYWTPTWGKNYMAHTGLNLQEETTYYISVRYDATEGCHSQIGCSDGIKYVDWDRTYGYDDDNGTRTIVNANGTSARFTYDERHRLRQVKNMDADGDGITGAVLNYTVDGVGNREDIWFNENYASSRNVFEYDEINRLEDADYNASSGIPDATFTYDWVGNRSQAGTYSYDAADRLGGASYPWSYYGTGSLKAISGSPTLTFTYDPRELLSVAAEEE